MPDVMQRVHWDPAFARRSGNPTTFDYGRMREFWLIHACTDWMGDDAWLWKLSCEFRAFNYVGDTQWVSGRVAKCYLADGDRPAVDLTLSARNQRGAQTTTGTATIEAAGNDETVRAVLLTATGEHFCSGFDIVARNRAGPGNSGTGDNGYPFFHCAGLKSAVLACILTGVTIVPCPVFDMGTVLGLVARERISMLPGPPALYQSLLNADLSGYDRSSLRLAVTGAASVPVDLVRRMREDLGFAAFVTGYGLTETTGTVSMCRHDDPIEVIATTSGRPIPGLRVRVVDPVGADVPAGEPGEVWVRGYAVMRCYFDAPEATAAAFTPDGWLRTGDIGVLDAEGNLAITDRIKDMFIVGGFNAYPAEIENLMSRHPDIAQVAVVGVADERLGEVGFAYVIPRQGSAPTAAGLIAWCRGEMANFKVPRQVEFVQALPLNPSGKVLKFELRDRARKSAHQR